MRTECHREKRTEYHREKRSVLDCDVIDRRAEYLARVHLSSIFFSMLHLVVMEIEAIQAHIVDDLNHASHDPRGGEQER